MYGQVNPVGWSTTKLIGSTLLSHCYAVQPTHIVRELAGHSVSLVAHTDMASAKSA